MSVEARTSIDCKVAVRDGHSLMERGLVPRKELDIQMIRYIIMFTVNAGPATNETISVTRTGHVESSPESSAGRELPRQRVLRSGRLGAGQVRDAATGGCRQATGQSGSKDVWLFAPVILSGTDSLSRSWPCRAVAAETRASIRAQAHTRAHAVRGTTSARRADDFQSANSRTHRPALQSLGSPAQHRSSATASKKTAVSSKPDAIPFPDRRLIAAYEELRLQAVQGLRRGPGLALMMARGVRCWMEACSQLFANEASFTPVPDRSAPSVPSGLRGDLVMLLASMLLHRASKEMA